MPEFRLETVIRADTLEEAQERLALVQAAVSAVEDARKPQAYSLSGMPKPDPEALEALDRRLGGLCTCGASDALDVHDDLCPVRSGWQLRGRMS